MKYHYFFSFVGFDEVGTMYGQREYTTDVPITTLEQIDGISSIMALKDNLRGCVVLNYQLLRVEDGTD